MHILLSLICSTCCILAIKTVLTDSLYSIRNKIESSILFGLCFIGAILLLLK